MGLLKTIKNLFTSSKKKEEKTAGTTSQSSPASGRTVVVGKSLVKLPAATDTKTDTKSRKSGTTESKSGSTGQKSGTGSTKTDNTAEKKSTGTRNNGTSSDGTKVAVGKTSVTLPKTGETKKTETSLSSAWQNHKEKMQQKQLEGIQKQKERQQAGPVTEGNSIAAIVNRGLQGFNEKQQEKNAAEKAEKQQEYQLEMLYGAVQTYEKQLTALKNKAERDPESITQADVDQYNTWWEQYQTVIGNYNNVVEKIQTKQAQKEQDQQKIRAALGLDAGIVDAPQAGNQSVFDIDPQKYAQDVEKTNEGASVAAQQLRAQLPKTLAAIGTAGVAGAQDALANAMGLGENIVWALSPGAQKDAASAADHAKQVQAWKAEQQNAKDKMQKAFELTEDDQLGQFLVELNYNFVQQGAAMVAGGAIGKAGGTALRAAGGAYKAAGANMAGKIGSQAAQRAAAAADLSGKALQGAAKYLQKNAGLATMATLAGSTNYQAAIEGGASNEQAMAYAVLTAAAEAVTEKLFGGNPLMDNEAGLVNRALYRMLGDKKFLQALDSMPVEVFNEGFEEVIANYLYSGAQAVTGQKVELPTAQENLHSFAMGAAMGGIGQAAKAASGTVNQALEDREIGKKLQEMGAADELIATGLELPGSRAQMRAKELQMKGSLPTARELGRQYRENVAAQKLLTARQMDTERTVRQMAQDVGAQVVFDDAIANAAGKDNAANGYYQNGVLHISRDADQPAIVVAKHELTHYLQQAAQAEYNAFRAYAMSLQGENAVQEMQERYARGGVTLSEEEAMDEIAADFTEQLLTDSESIKQLINTNPTLADRFFAALREFLQKLTGRVDPKLKKAEQLWTEAYKAAQGNKNTAREGGGEKQYSFKTGEYDYKTLTEKPDMALTEVDDTVQYNTDSKSKKNIVNEAKKNAAIIGRTNENGGVEVYVDDIGVNVVLSTDGLKHGLDRRTQLLAPVTVNAGQILKNAIRINELIPRKDTIDNTYALLGAAQGKSGDVYIVEFVVNRFDNTVASMDVLYSVNTKKESAALNAPRLTVNPLSVTDSKISIAQLLDIARDNFPDILPESVLRHYGFDRRPEGKLGESALYSLKRDSADLKSMREERKQVREQIGHLEWLEERDGALTDNDAKTLAGLRTRERELNERIDAKMRAAKSQHGTEAERILKKGAEEAAAVRPTEAKKTLRTSLLDTFSIQAGSRKALGAKIDNVAAQILQKGYASASDEAELFRSLYNAGIVVDTTSSREYAEIRNDLKGVKLYVDPDIKAELGDSWNDVRNQAWGNRITLTTQEGEGIGIDVEHARLADTYPGMFDSYATDRTEMLEQMLRAAELGRPEHISLMESAMREGGEDAVAQQMMFFDKYLSNALTNFSEQAGFEMRIKQGEILKSAKLRAATADAVEKQSRRKALAEAQNKTLRVFKQLRKMRKTENAETQKLIDELVGGFDTMAKSLRKDKEATWRNLRDIYEAKKRDDPNFLPDKDLEAKFARLDQIRIGEMSREEAVELYRAGTQLIHDIRTANKEIAEKNARDLSKLYEDSVAEIRSSQGDLREYSKTAKGRENLKGMKRRYWNEEQLSPMNYIEKMGGWRRDGEFYSMAKQLERGEYDKQRYIVHSDALMEKFTKENAEWIAKADGKGKDAIWYEVEVPAIFVRGHGNERVEEMNTVKVAMTPMMKVKLYLDSLSYDNLRHIRYGGATFPDRKLYAAGNTKAAFAQGTTVKLQPEIVKNLVKDLTPQEKELAKIIGDQYFNGYAKEEINRVSNLLVGYDKAMADYYSPIFTNHNFLSNNTDAVIMDATIEGGGMLKNRIWSGTPSLAVSVMDAYEKHRDFTAKYVGIAIPVRNMNALLNYTESGYMDSMREVISKKWGADSVKYLDDLLVNLQNKPAAETNILDDKINKVLNNYVTAVFGFNPGTVVKQAPGFYMAGARLGFDTMPAASLFLPSLSKYRDLIGKYTPLLEWRARGYSSREMAELRNNPNWTQKNAATRFIFGGAIQWMDLHTCAAVWPWAENYVKKHYPELKPGSKAQIDAGKDPFYQKVAEVYEDAIANSQPMYDDMHTAKILHTNNGVARSITMFHTAQMTQANAIRQAHGELKRAMEDAKKQPTKENTAAVKHGQHALVNGVMALLLSTLGFEAVGALVAIAKRKDKALRDEDGELTPESVGKYMADATVKDLLGNIVGWDTAYDLGTHVFFGDTWYGFEMPGVDILKDFFDDAASLKKAATTFTGGLMGISDAGELQYYLKSGGSDLRKSLKNVSMDLSYIFGVPAKNMETYTLGLMGWINPELAAAYDNATNGEYTKATMAGLQGKPREQQAALKQILKNRAADVSDEAVEELQRLYGTAGTEILPSAVPGSVNVKTGEDTSEEVKLTNKQKVDYKAAYSKTVSDGLNELVTADAYQKLDDEQKAGAVAMLYQYASEQGKAAVVDGYEPTGWKSKAADAAREGASISQMMIYKAATAEIVSEKDENGNAIDGSTARQKADWLQSSGWSEDAQAAIYFADAASESRLENRDALSEQGVSQTVYYRYLTEAATVEPDYDENGKTVNGSKNKKLFELIDGMDLTEDQKTAIYLSDVNKLEDDNGNAKYTEAVDAGISLYDYVKFTAETGAMANVKDGSGNTVKAKRDQVLAYINSMNLSSAQKDILYYDAGYKESTISDAPWRGGSVKTGSSGSSGSSGSKKTVSQAQKAAARAAAANSPAVQKLLSRGGYVTASLPKAGEPARTGTLPKAGEMDAIQRLLSRGGYADGTDAVQRYLEKYGG